MFLKNGKFTGIRTKLGLSYMFISIMCTTLSLIIYYRSNIELSEKKMFTTDYQQLIMIRNYFDDMINETERISKDIFLNNNVQNVLANGKDKDYFIYQRDLYKYLHETLNKSPHITAVYVVDMNSNIYYADIMDRKKTYSTDFLESLNLEEIKKQKGTTRWTVQSNEFIKDDNDYMVLSRMINNKTTFMPIGYMIITIDINHINELFNRYSNNDLYRFLLTDSNSNVLLNSAEFDSSEVKKSLKEIPDLQKEYYKVQKGKAKNYIVKLPLNALKWNIASICLYNDVKLYSLEENIISIIIFNALGLAAGSMLISFIILKPLGKLSSIIRKIGEGKLDLRYKPEKSNDEINLLGVSLNNMMDEINMLLDQIKKEHEIQRQLELTLISEQIKPHFLYNTLGAASIYVSMMKNKEAMHMLNTLAAYYRLCLNNGKEVITLAEEVQLLKNYIEIMLLRTGDIFDIIYDFDEELMCYKIPKLTLQPIVENAVHHGISSLGRRGVIKCSIKKQCEDQQLILCVEDNGTGMDESLIKKIYKQETLKIDSGFGIKGTIQRLMIFFNEEKLESIAEVESRIGEYTRITFKLPYNKEYF
jgi:two-component system sensor histidine kinase YesM